MDDISRAGGPSIYDQAMPATTLSPRVSLWVTLFLAVVLGALSVLVLYPAAEQFRSLRGGTRANATLIEAGACMAGHCRIEFQAGGRTVEAGLPIGSAGGKDSVGTEWAVRYRASDPQEVVRVDDLDGGGMLPLAWLSSATTVLCAAGAVYSAVRVARQRRTSRVAGRSGSGPDAQ
ncbi:hypothetical protein DSC45_23705 [Streptomyces sp. YIM 130001]|uniref:hypothetical protein n=1 Tax=Streptomyces sp. YIM 130001 TaxID=2259644 RepID=UPI000ED64DBB|nr:hypothetical protein [Streptomyces sp. YIM 130001]RII13359.1 hypothetical protein DSC45_23705 [Streptomyces sp. YIM 130001]